MNNNSNKVTKLTVIKICFLLSFCAMGEASALVIDDGVVIGNDWSVTPPHSTIGGKTIAQWGEEWWKWVLETPTVPAPGLEHPQLDTSGASAHLGDVGGPVFFLAGNFGGTSERTFSAPQGKYFLLPLVNTVWIPDPGESLQDAINGSTAYINGVISLNASIDGAAIADLPAHRETTTLSSGGFSFTVPENGLVAPGTYGPTAQDGYWVLLTLSPGQHTISFSGATATDTFSTTDHIHVVPIPGAIWLFTTALFGLGAFRKHRKAE